MTLNCTKDTVPCSKMEGLRSPLREKGGEGVEGVPSEPTRSRCDLYSDGRTQALPDPQTNQGGTPCVPRGNVREGTRHELGYPLGGMCQCASVCVSVRQCASVRQCVCAGAGGDVGVGGRGLSEIITVKGA